MEDFDLPTAAVPVEFLNGLLWRSNLEIGDELPIDSLSVFGNSPFPSENHREHQGIVSVALSEGRQHF